VRIANVGIGDAGAFNVRTVLDPTQSVVVNQAVSGLPIGEQTLTVTTPPGGNCFDPDCTICVTVDSANAVTESDEGNNNLCATTGG
jgi:subtilase family serine protease